ncbi:hypothetical protein AB1I63_10020 [Streptococcus pneumoniae]
MVFRKTVDEYEKWPVGEVSPYGEELYIDVENNVYFHTGTKYIKVGYDIPVLDDFVKLIPEIGIGLFLANIFLPQRRKGEESDFWAVVIGFIVGLLFLLWYHLIAWIGYKIVTLFAERLIRITEHRKWLRLCLPCTWFMDKPDKKLLSIGMGATMFPLYFILAIPTVIAMANGYFEGAGLGAFFIPVCFVLSGFDLWINIGINRRNGIDKY